MNTPTIVENKENARERAKGEHFKYFIFSVENDPKGFKSGVAIFCNWQTASHLAELLKELDADEIVPAGQALYTILVKAPIGDLKNALMK